MIRWHRINPRLGGQVVGMLAIGIVVVAVPVVFARHPAEPVQALSACLAVGLLAWGVRQQFLGVFVSDRGVKFSSTTVDDVIFWSEIAAFEPRRASIAEWLREPALSLWIVTREGGARETPLVRQALITVEQPRGAVQKFPPPALYLDERVFDRVVETLRRELADRAQA
ncbi:MAG: hypothetical protein HOY71_55040 [Nonomuraea sp.]|nr:hypothetical protein [Nonomuraea sp.]